MPPRIRDILDQLRRNGWFEVARRGSWRRLGWLHQPSSFIRRRSLKRWVEEANPAYVLVQGGHTRQPPLVQGCREPGRVKVAGKPRDDLPAGTLNSILKQAGLKR